MGEYATFRGQRIKIGTCEDMLYLRWDQVHLVTPEEGSDLIRELETIRFRFPWPDEDDRDPGDFDDPERGMRLDIKQPPEVGHGLVQFRASNGYLVSLPCPEGPGAVYCAADSSDEVERDVRTTIHRSGYGGPASLVQQAWRGGRLVGIARCNGCRTAYRLDDGYEEAAAVAIRSLGDRGHRTAHQIADRLLAGYAQGAGARS